MKDIFWLDNPLILFKKDQIFQLWPSTNLTVEKKLNALTRLFILLTLIGYAITKRFEFFIVSFLTLLGITLLYKKRQIQYKVVKEAFTTPKKTNNINNKVKSEFFNLQSDNYTQPTKNNPMMNVLLTDIIDNPKRPPAAPAYEPPINKAINNSTMDPRLFLDLGDNLSFDRSMRNFYAMPNTKIPADQKGFAEFCYGDMPSCKEGNEFQCAKNNTSSRPWK